MPPRKRRVRELTPPRDFDEDAEMEEEEKKIPIPKTMSDTERERLLQTSHELQLLTAAEQPADLFSAEYENPQPQRTAVFVPAAYHMPARHKYFQ